MKHQNRLVALCAGFLGLCAPALASSGFDLGPSAQNPPAPPPSDAWKFKLKPYFWMASISGDAQVGNLPSQSVDISFNDLWDNMDFGAMLGFEARKGDSDVAFLTDLFYMNLGDNGSNVDVNFEGLMGEFDVAFRPWEPTWLEGLVGMRYWNLHAEIDPNGPPHASGTKDWVDPVVGLRGMIPLSEAWTTMLRADYGGFDVGSKSTYQLAATVAYAFNNSLSAAIGYRYLNFDYRSDNGDFDLDFSGPMAGVVWSF